METLTPKIAMETLTPKTAMETLTLASKGRKQMGDERDGNSLLEVFQIVYLGDDEIHPEDQVGTIKMISNRGVQYLYNAIFVHPYFNPSLKRGDQILVAVNSPTIRCGYHLFEFDLFNHAYKGTIVMDWTNAVFTEPTCWEKKIHKKDRTGSIAVHFGLFPYARVARIEINILDDSIEFAYGVVAASNSGLPRCPASILLANDADHPICPYQDSEVSLSKSRVAVPLDTTLFVDVSLNCDGKDFNERLAFKCQKDGVVVLLDPSNKIHVRVTWGGDMDSILSTYNNPDEGREW